MNAQFNGYVFQWGPNEYYVRRNNRGLIVWSRMGGRNGFPKRVNRERHDGSKFSTLLTACADKLESEG